MEENWKPDRGVAFALAVLLPMSAMLYVNKPRLFLVYLIVFVVAAKTVLLFLYPLSLYFFWIAYVIHVDWIVRNYDNTLKRSWWSRLWGLLLALILVVVFAFLLNSFFLSSYRIPSNSMSPNVRTGDMILVRRWGFGEYGMWGITISDPGLSDSVAIERSKLYVFKVDGRFILKRVIGLPGDVVSFDGERITIDGRELVSEFLEESRGGRLYKESVDGHSYTIARRGGGRPDSAGKWSVPEDHYFFVGDNRDNSRDSRHFGPISANDFVGEVIYVFDNMLK